MNIFVMLFFKDLLFNIWFCFIQIHAKIFWSGSEETKKPADLYPVSENCLH
jgi:hypothetical protein